MNTEPKVVSTQTTISSTVAASEVKPQQVQAQTPDHKVYVTEMRKELSENVTTTPSWIPGNNGNLMVRNHKVIKCSTFQCAFFVIGSRQLSGCC